MTWAGPVESRYIFNLKFKKNIKEKTQNCSEVNLKPNVEN